jgi:small nuclear ribonucleoprotein (snRNP)-like protein
MATNGEKYKKNANQFKTLTPLLRFFVGLELRVELKNGKSYHGFLHESDDDMNVTLSTSNTSSNIEENMLDPPRDDGDNNDIRGSNIPCNNNEQLGAFQFSKMHIRGSSIRYIQFPDNVDLPLLIKIGLDRKRAAHDKYARGKRQKR